MICTETRLSYQDLLQVTFQLLKAFVDVNLCDIWYLDNS